MCERDNGGTYITKNQVDYVKGSPEMQANDFFELDFRAWVIEQIRKHGSYPKSEAIHSGAEVVGCSSLTSRRYLEKMLSAEGVLQEDKNPLKQMILTFKPVKKAPGNGHINIDELLKAALAYQVKKPERSK